MVVAQQPSGQMMTALKECQQQAQKCVDEFDQGAERDFAIGLAGPGRRLGPHGGTSGGASAFHRHVI